MFYPKIKIVHKLIIPPLSAFILGLLFIFLMVSEIHGVQDKIQNLEVNLIPSVEKSTQNLTQLKNISEKFVFAILASEIDMLPTSKDAQNIEENLKAIIENRSLEMVQYPNIVKSFKSYFTFAHRQAKRMISHSEYEASASEALDLMKQYKNIENDFLNINKYLKNQIMVNTKAVKEITSQIIDFTIVFMVIFAFFLFTVSYVVYTDFNHKFRILKTKLEELDVLNKDDNINLNLDELSMLSMKINHNIETFKNLEKEKNEIEYLANRDQLTNLFNRRYIEIVHTAIKKNQVNFGVMILDIDFFKRINDTYGHDIGDAVLVKFAHILKDYTREDDIVVRYGGEEFVIIMQNISEKILFTNAERLRKTIEMTDFPKIDKVTVSIGLAFNTENYDIYESIKYADVALYQAKESGRNKVIVYL